MTEINELAKISFGKTSFIFKIDKEVEKFLEKEGIPSDRLVPTASSWYLEVLKSLGKEHNQKINLEIIFSFSKDFLQQETDSEFISASPLRYQDTREEEKNEEVKRKEELVYFGVCVSEKENSEGNKKSGE